MMDVILGRSQFLSEAANLFTDEKTAHARSRIVEWLNELPTAEAHIKCELLAKVQEMILGSLEELLDEFLEPILSLSHDGNMEVRKQVIGFMEQICKHKVEQLPHAISIISMLLRDRSPQVIKRAIQACSSIYRNGMEWICSLEELTDSAEQTWNVLSLVKAQILDLIDNDNEGIRTNAIKFLEGVVVLQSYPDEDSRKKDNDFSLEDVPNNFKIIKRQKLEEEALNIFDIMLQFHAATHISAVNLIICTASLCNIAKLRPSLMGPVVEAFKNLNVNLPPTLTDSQISSVRKSLKMQLIALLKNRGSYEFQSIIRHLLSDLGTSQGEIQRAIPKMDKQEQVRRQKRIFESSHHNQGVSKRMRLGEIRNVDSNKGNTEKLQFEIDDDELERQRQKCARVNEKFLTEHLRFLDIAVNILWEFLPNLPQEISPEFLEVYTPIKNMSVTQQVAKISKMLGEQMAEKKIGPGSAAFTKDPPMRPVTKLNVTEAVQIDENTNDSSDAQTSAIHEDQLRKEEATKKLRENMERLKGEQELIERMKLRAKTLKLQEVTKPFSRSVKEKFLVDAVKRILQAERKCFVGGLSSKRRKILTVMSATFPDNVRYLIFDFIMADVRQRIDLVFSWLYEEYCLLQGFTRHSYVKSENRPDYAYNELLNKLITGIRKNCDLKDKIMLIQRIYLEAPILSEEAFGQLVEMCFEEQISERCLELLKDLVVLRPPRKNKVMRILLSFCVHEHNEVRERALEHIVTLYHVHNIHSNRIDEFVTEWLGFLEKDKPPANLFSSDYGRPQVELEWKEETVKKCLILALTLLPYKPEMYLEKLYKTYIATAADQKRTILRSIDIAIRKLRADHPVLLKFIEECPKGAETFLIRVVYIITERVATPNVELMQRIRELYAHKYKDVRLLIPILSGLTRQEILNILPNLLKLNPIVVKEVFNRLLVIGTEYSNQVVATTPIDILVALHTIDLSACDLKHIVKATSICLAEKEIYTQEVLIGVLQQLVEIVPIPTLLMRTIIQSLTLYPRLTNFVLNLLQRLILKKIWNHKVIWEGFLKCCQRLKPQSLPVLLHLPAQQLALALEQSPDFRTPLLEYVESIQDEPMSGISPQILDVISGKSVDVFVTDESGGYIKIDNIKKEIEDPSDVNVITTVPVLETIMATAPHLKVANNLGSSNPGQPLPPGED